MTNGGVIIGSTDRIDSRRRPFARPRVTISTKQSASSVAALAVISPS